MTERPGRKLSRRGLLGVFGAGAKGFRDTLEREASNISSGARPGATPRSTFERKLRPREETAIAQLVAPGEWTLDLNARPLGVGGSWRVVGEALAEPLLVLRVNPTHVAAVGGECPVDGSDLFWLAFEDRVACPACGSRWRLDGDLTRGPADSRGASFVVEETAGVLRVRATS